MSTFPEIKRALRQVPELNRTLRLYDRCADIMDRSKAAMGRKQQPKVMTSSTSEVEITNESLRKTKVSNR